MTDKEMIKKLRKAYEITPSSREIIFVRKHEIRSLRLFDILLLELKYIGIKGLLSISLLTIVFYVITKTDNVQATKSLASILPVMALLMTTCIGRSERFGMEELEASSRFSARFIKLIRLFLLGVGSLSLLGIVSVLIHSIIKTNPVLTIGMVGIPYLTNVWGSLMITRKWHAKENIYGCVALTIFTCFLPTGIDLAGKSVKASPMHLIIVLLVVTTLAVREAIIFAKESEEVSWNLC